MADSVRRSGFYLICALVSGMVWASAGWGWVCSNMNKILGTSFEFGGLNHAFSVKKLDEVLMSPLLSPLLRAYLLVDTPVLDVDTCSYWYLLCIYLLTIPHA